MLLAGQISQPAGVSHLWEGAQHKSCPRETLPPAQRHHFGQKGFLFVFTIFHNTRKTPLFPPALWVRALHKDRGKESMS